MPVLNRDSLIGKLAGGTTVNLSGSLVRIVLIFLHGLVVARLFGAAAYGAYFESVATVILLSAVGQIGLARAVTRFVAIYRVRYQSADVRTTLKTALGVAIPVALGIGLLLSAGSEQIAALFHEPELAAWFRLLGFGVPLLTLATLLGAFTQGFQKMQHKTIALDMVAPAVELLALVLLVQLGLRSLSLPVAYLVSLVVAVILLVIFLRQHLRSLAIESQQGSSDPSEARIKAILSFSLPVWLAEVLMAATARSSVIMLGLFATSAAVGIFGIAQRLVGLGGVFLLSINMMIGPMVADIVERKQYDELARLHKISTRWILGVCLPLFILLAFLGDGILGLYGEEFLSGSVALSIMIIGVILDLSSGASGTILIMSGRPRYNAFNELIRLVVIVWLSTRLISQYGALGAAIPIAVGTAIFSILQVIEVYLHLGIHPYGRAVFKVGFAAGVMGMSALIWRVLVLSQNAAWHMYLAGGALALAIYIAILLILGLESIETDLVHSVWRRITRHEVLTV